MQFLLRRFGILMRVLTGDQDIGCWYGMFKSESIYHNTTAGNREYLPTKVQSNAEDMQSSRACTDYPADYLGVAPVFMP